MTVSQLIAVLKGHPPDLRVVVNGYENGFDVGDEGLVRSGSRSRR